MNPKIRNTPQFLLPICIAYSLGACQLAGMVGLVQPGSSNKTISAPKSSVPAQDISASENSDPAATPTPVPPSSSSPATSPPATSPAGTALATPTVAPAPAPAKAKPTSNRSDGRRYASKEEFDAYHALIDEHGNVLEILSHLKEGRIKVPFAPEQAAKYVKELAPSMKAAKSFAAECDAYRKLVVMNLRPWHEPTVACDNVKSASNATSKLASLVAKRYLKGQVKVILADLAALGNGYASSDFSLNKLLKADSKVERARVAKSLGPLLSLAGEGLDLDKEIPDIAQLRKEAWAKGVAETQTHLFRSKAKASISKAVKASFRKRKPSPKVLKILAKSKDWTVHKRHTGIPSYRGQAIQLIGKVKGESFCRLYDMTARQSYAGRWQKSVNITVDNGFRLMKCK